MAVESPISRRRSCTDLPCLAVFAAFLVGWVVVAGIAMSEGSIKRFTMPSDSNGNICGVDKGVEKKPYLLFFDLIKCARTTTFIYGCPTPQMCVKECPSSYFYGSVPALLTKAKLNPLISDTLKAKLQYCLPHVNKTKEPYARLVDGYHCAPWYVYSTPMAGRCLPANITSAITNLKSLSREMHQSLAGTEARSLVQPDQSIQLMVDFQTNISTLTNGTVPTFPGFPTINGTSIPWPKIKQPNITVTLPGRPKTSEGQSITKRIMRAASEAIRQMRFIGVHLAGLTCASLVTPLVLALLVVLLLRWFIKPIVALLLVMVAIVLLCATALCAHAYVQVRDAAEAEQEQDDLEDEQGKADVSPQEQPESWLGATIACGILLLLYLILVIALRRRIMLAVVILEQCSIAFGDMLTLVLVPVMSFALQLVVCLMFVLVMVFLFGSRHEWRVTGECRDCDRYTTGDRCYPAEFDARCGEICPNATCSSTQNLPLYGYNGFAVIWGVCFVAAINQIAVAIAFSTWYFSSSKRLSLALPLRAYLLALLFHSGTAAFGSLLIAITKAIRFLLNRLKASLKKRSGRTVQCLITCCEGCFWCVENVIAFINRRAYIVTALESVGLCTAGRRGMAVVARNLARVAVADSVTALVLWLGRVLVMVGSIMLCHWLMAAAVAEPVPWLLPAIFTGIISYAVAGTTFSLFAMGVDTIFYCAMVDLDENDGSSQKPYAMSRSLAKALGVTHEQPPSPPGPVTTGQPPTAPPKSPVGRAPSDSWAQQKQQQMPDQFTLPGQVERPITPATPPLRKNR